MSVDEVAANDDDVARAQVLSLHASEDDAIGERLVSSAPDPQAVLEHRERLTYLTEAIAELPERLRLVVEQYFLAERPMAEIAETLGVTESRVSQLRAEALVLLRDALNNELDPDLVQPAARPGGCCLPAPRGLLRRGRRPARRRHPPLRHRLRPRRGQRQRLISPPPGARPEIPSKFSAQSSSAPLARSRSTP